MTPALISGKNPTNEPAKPLRDAQTGGSLFAYNPLIFKGGKNNRKIITIFVVETQTLGFIACISKPLTNQPKKMKTTNYSTVILVNNTCADISNFTNIFINAIITNSDLPEEIADLFSLEIINVEDGIRGILNFA